MKLSGKRILISKTNQIGDVVFALPLASAIKQAAPDATILFMGRAYTQALIEHYQDVDEFVNCVKLLGPSWGGINLEDIAAPDCFIIEQRLREAMDIPVFHDDQHGTAIISAAGLINAAQITGRKFEDMKMVVLGAGSAGIACLELIKRMGVKQDNALLIDRQGVIYKGREGGMNQWKSAHAADTDKRTLEEAMDGADVFLGLASKDAISPEMVKSMAKNPILFTMANPDPEIKPELAKEVRPDAIIATGRSDYPNQVNNVMGFPYIFRGALDVRASSINEEMKVAAAEALAKLAREDVPDEVLAAYSGRHLQYGPDYIIPTPFDPRLIATIPPAVAKAAMDTGVARKPIANMEKYKQELQARRDPTANALNLLFEKVKTNPQRIIFAEGEEERAIRAALAYRTMGLGEPILIGREEVVRERIDQLGLPAAHDLQITNARLSPNNDRYTDFLYERLQRRGYLHRDVARMVNNDRNIHGACMVAMHDADGMVTGLTRAYSIAFDEIARVIDPLDGKRVLGVSVLLAKGRTVFIADTNIHEMPTAEELADTAEAAAAVARKFGHEPRVAFLTYSTFGTPPTERTEKARDAVAILEERGADFEFEGDLGADVALDHDLLTTLYPFQRLSGSANVLIMPAVHAASIASKMLTALGGATIIGPLLTGLSRPIQIAPIGSTVSDLVNIAALTAYDLTDQ